MLLTLACGADMVLKPTPEKHLCSQSVKLWQMCKNATNKYTILKTDASPKQKFVIHLCIYVNLHTACGCR